MMSLMILLSSLVIPNHSLTKPTNKHFWHSLETDIEPAKIWDVWTNVKDWHEWDTGLQTAEMKDPFKKGSKGFITSLEGRRSKFKIVAYEKGKSYTFRTPLLFSSLYVKRYFSRENEKTFITHEVWFKGLTGGLFAKRFGPEFRAMLPGVMEKVLEKAQEL